MTRKIKPSGGKGTTYDIVAGDEFRIMGERVSGVNKLIVYQVADDPVSDLVVKSRKPTQSNTKSAKTPPSTSTPQSNKEKV